MSNRTVIFGLTWPLIIAIIISGLLIGIFVSLYFGSKLPMDIPVSKVATIIYDVNGEEITRLFLENRIEVDIDRIPKLMKDAIISVEDQEFYTHRGINFKAILRALWVDIRSGEYQQGASTITQQLAKNALLTHEKKLSRKIKEALIAINIERTLTKEEILEQYLNYIYFGHGRYGVEAAAQWYFNKSIWELELHQFALLAGIVKGPEIYSPYKDPKAALKRRSIVLNSMLEMGFITKEEMDAANKKPLDVFPLRANRRKAPYFVDYIIQELVKKYNFTEEILYTRGYKIYTTLDLNLQSAAEEAFTELPTAKEPDKNGVTQPQAALVALDPKNGHIRAMIGGRDFQNTQLNRAVMAYRQPGSAIKPFVYIAAIDSGKFTPASVLIDEPVEYPAGKDENGEDTFWTPQNYDKTYQGPLRLREALKHSINTIAVKLVDELGPSAVIRTGQKMGLTSLITSGEKNDLGYSSLALGGLTKGVTPMEIAAAYTPLANRGIYSEPMAILKVIDDHNQTVVENIPHRQVVLKETTAYLITDMLKDAVEEGTGKRARLDRPAAGKTGTTSDYTNAWFVGYTPDLLASIWIGNDSQAVPLKIDGYNIGSATAARIWGIFMRKALADKPITDFTPPQGIRFGVKICAQSGLQATPFCPEVITEIFIEGTEPTTSCNLHSETAPLASTITLEICLDSGQLATPDCPRERVVRKTYWVTTGLEIKDETPLPTEKCRYHGRENEVTVSICTESGLLATPFCPVEAVFTQTFKEGEEPTLYCNKHLPNRNRRHH